MNNRNNQRFRTNNHNNNDNNNNRNDNDFLNGFINLIGHGLEFGINRIQRRSSYNERNNNRNNNNLNRKNNNRNNNNLNRNNNNFNRNNDFNNRRPRNYNPAQHILINNRRNNTPIFGRNRNNIQPRYAIENNLPEIVIQDVANLEEGNKKCVICLEEFVSKEKLTALPCIHFFHTPCIKNWLKKQKNCPICKFELTQENLNKKIKENS